MMMIDKWYIHTKICLVRDHFLKEGLSTQMWGQRCGGGYLMGLKISCQTLYDLYARRQQRAGRHCLRSRPISTYHPIIAFDCQVLPRESSCHRNGLGTYGARTPASSMWLVEAVEVLSCMSCMALDSQSVSVNNKMQGWLECLRLVIVIVQEMANFRSHICLDIKMI